MGKDQELLEAARNGNIPIVEKILSQRAKRSGPLASLRRGPGANVQDSSGYSALHHAALNGHREAVELLLAHEASVNLVDGKGSSPLHLAAWAGSEDVVRLLLCRGPSVPKVNLTTKDNETALHCAAQYGHTVVVQLLLEHRCDPAIKNCRDETALDLAAQYGRLDTVELLLRTHPELLAQYTLAPRGAVFPHTPLHRASRNGHKAVVQVLLNSGFPVSALTNAGTALHEAALCGKLEVVRCLLERGVSLAARDQAGHTVLEVLAQFPAHLTHEMSALITRHKHRRESGGATLPSPAARGAADGEDKENAVPPGGHATLGSPYDNVRPSPRGSSPSWPGGGGNYYDGGGGEERRVSGASAISVPAPRSGRGESPAGHPLARSLDSAGFVSSGLSARSMDSCLSEDQLSVSSSSSVSASPRDRRFLPLDTGAPGNYLPMSGRSHHAAKVSPTPPKKPPRRNLSVSPTHGGDGPTTNYEYLFLARSGNANSGGERRGRDGYVDMRLRLQPTELLHIDEPSGGLRHRRSDSAGEEGLDRGDLEPQPCTERRHTTIGQYENVIRAQQLQQQQGHHYPRRKLRRHNGGVSCDFEDPKEPTFVSSAYIRLRPSQENMQSEDAAAKKKKTLQVATPLSPTHYQQPPTPDHPPPSALDAERSIHERIRPLSQEYKRRSRDIETETEDDLLVVLGGGASSGSLSSCSVSLSERSLSTDCYVEEYLGDQPFAGLLKGSTQGAAFAAAAAAAAEATCECRMERPKSLQGRPAPSEEPEHHHKPPSSTTVSSRTGASSILSPFDEQEEWAKISEIMASFGTGLVRESVFVSELENEFQTRLGLSRSASAASGVNPGSTEGSQGAKQGSENTPPTTVQQWLTSIGLPQYESNFKQHGYDHIGFINGVLLPSDLPAMGVADSGHAEQLLQAAASLPRQLPEFGRNGARVPASVEEWLRSIRLECHADTFKRHLYTDMQRVLRIWDVEVTTVLDIEALGHRRRILASVGAPAAAAPDLGRAEHPDTAPDLHHQAADGKLTDGSNEDPPPTTGSGLVVPSGGGTLRHSHKKSRPAPPPPGQQPPQAAPNSGRGVAPLASAEEDVGDLELRDPGELLVGVPAALTMTQWKHRPQSLLSGKVAYAASYLGSTLVKELRGTESTKKSIQKLKRVLKGEPGRQTPEVLLSISHRGVQFLEPLSKETVCDHEIRNIHCACQDADDLTHFAYITKDLASKDHYCHVFCVATMDQATEIILTLGQAFEVAYQLALKEQFSSSSSRPGHSRSQSAALPRCMSLGSGGAGGPGAGTGGTNGGASHTRSHSVNGAFPLDPPPAPPSGRAPIVFTEDM